MTHPTNDEKWARAAVRKLMDRCVRNLIADLERAAAELRRCAK
jgi:hypothetical protein